MATNLPKTMRALLQPSPHSTALILSKIPLPVPTATEHLIKVRTTAFTNNELHWVAGFPTISQHPQKLPIPCYEMAGTIISSPPSSKFVPGDEVWSRTDFYRSGTAAEYTVAPESELAKRAKSMSWEEAATVPMSALTAWQTLFVQAGLKPEKGASRGKKVFVTASSGAVGRWMVQLAVWAGAEVVGTASGAAIETVKGLGAAQVLDYRSVDLKAWVGEQEGRKADVVIDTIGGKPLGDAWWVVKDDGIFVSVHTDPGSIKPVGVSEGIKAWFFIMEANGEQLEKITELIDGGGFVGQLDSVWKLEDGAEAVEKLESGRAKGKIVLDLSL